jgi:hypothetical protein
VKFIEKSPLVSSFAFLSASSIPCLTVNPCISFTG